MQNRRVYGHARTHARRRIHTCDGCLCALCLYVYARTSAQNDRTHTHTSNVRARILGTVFCLHWINHPHEPIRGGSDDGRWMQKSMSDGRNRMSAILLYVSCAPMRMCACALAFRFTLLLLLLRIRNKKTQKEVYEERPYTRFHTQEFWFAIVRFFQYERNQNRWSANRHLIVSNEFDFLPILKWIQLIDLMWSLADLLGTQQIICNLPRSTNFYVFIEMARNVGSFHPRCCLLPKTDALCTICRTNWIFLNA